MHLSICSCCCYVTLVVSERCTYGIVLSVRDWWQQILKKLGNRSRSRLIQPKPVCRLPRELTVLQIQQVQQQYCQSTTSKTRKRLLNILLQIRKPTHHRTKTYSYTMKTYPYCTRAYYYPQITKAYVALLYENLLYENMPLVSTALRTPEIHQLLYQKVPLRVLLYERLPLQMLYRNLPCILTAV